MPRIESFSRHRRDDDKRVARMEAFSAKLFRQSAYGADEIRKVAEDKTIQQGTYGLDSIQWFAVFNEFHYFYLHITDRMAFSRLSESGRSQVMNDLASWSIKLAVQTICEGWPEDKIRGIEKESLANLNNAQEEFGQYKRMRPSPGESPAGTLIWEFGKSVAECAGRLMHIDYVNRAGQLATEGLTALDIKSFVSQCA